ncbi:uncharacterized protein BT62DRAFT_935364 [Guyanagaster necrorhizus]|uniref:Uncharacterized protein n=1 Tax=Guyanagaster necrorhizus TaxID=856835 RepID=A0A9P8APK7_9AGAR|nr:uncharacterized protein BT62DRAFT_935364 [Guyanagaster necrorhizus MCA 3950]KAG7443045.1 hypothetical protein BT62DRAFT_935364 [Guyanagaster necrorhizus MCA 3950]
MAASAFSVLPRYLQRRIDKVYTSTANSLHLIEAPPLKKNKQIASPSSSGGGGFLVEDVLIEAEDEIDASQIPNIPISSIPSALQLLDLPPDDEQVLTIFRQAASGWDEGAIVSTELSVSLDDWRAVCAILLEHYAQEYTDSDGDAISRPVSDPGSDYQAVDVDMEESDNASDDDYLDSAPSRRRTRTAARACDSDSDSDSTKPKQLTERQKQTCLETFALFFPNATPEDLPRQKIMTGDIQRVAKLLNEKLKAEEIIEMLENFSSAPDKSMTLADFECMMITAKLA